MNPILSLQKLELQSADPERFDPEHSDVEGAGSAESFHCSGVLPSDVSYYCTALA